MKFKKPREYDIPRCGLSFTKMSRLASETNGVNMVEGQDTKTTVFKVKSKAPELVFSFVAQMPELIVENVNSPGKKEQKRLKELSTFVKDLEPLMKDLDLYQEASTLMA